jgi:hypothetical protein
MGDEARQPLETVRAKPQCAIEPMKPRLGQFGGVADVVKVGSRHGRRAIVDGYHPADFTRWFGHRLCVRPARPSRAKRVLRFVARPPRDIHGARVR